MIARIYLGICAVVFFGLGIALLFWPAEILKSVEISFSTNTAFADIRADYGGCILGIGVFLAWCVSKPPLVRTGLLCTGFTFSGYVVGRLLSLMLDGMPKPIIFTLTIIEFLGAAAAFGLIPFAPEGLAGKTRILKE
jgi:hypothetical protein